MKILLSITIILCCFQDYSTAQHIKKKSKGSQQSSENSRTLQYNPNAKNNIHDLNEIKIQGPNGRFSISEVKPGNFGEISGCLTLKQNGPGLFSYKRDFVDDTIYQDMEGMLGYGKMVQNLMVGEEQILKVSGENSDNPKLQFVLFGENSIIRFEGRVEISGYTFLGEGAENDKLTFALIDNYGLVYLRGKGKVVFNDGKEGVLGE